MIQLIQIFVVAFAIFAISRAVLRFKDRKISALSLGLWCAIWIAAIVVVIVPSTSFFFANLLGIQRGADFVVYVSIVVLFYLLFRLYVKIDSTEQNVTRLVREIAINKTKKK
jgi:hypothetical protein